MKSSLDFDSKVVAAAGTPAQLGADTVAGRVSTLMVRAKDANTDLVYIQSAAIATTKRFPLSPGQSITLEPQNPGDYLTLGQFYIDAVVNGEGVDFFWMK